MMELTEAAECLKHNALIDSVDMLPKGHVRIASAFRYPDGSTVDLFIENRHDLLSKVSPLTLTDFGHTFLWLDQLDIRPLKSARRRQLTEDILETYGITHDRGALSCEVDKKDLISGIIRLGQACLRISDLTFTQRITAQGSFTDEVESLIRNSGLEYESNAKLIGRENADVLVDFLVHSPRVEKAILTLPAESTYKGVAKTRSREVFTRCYDLRGWCGQCVVALDDRRPSYQEDDLSRIQDVATIIPISDPAMMQEILLSAA